MAVWLRFRQQLFETYQIPTDFELHSTNFLAGRGHPSTENKLNQSKTARREIFVAALKLISDLPGVSIGAVHRTSSRPSRGLTSRRTKASVDDRGPYKLARLPENTGPSPRFPL